MHCCCCFVSRTRLWLWGYTS